MSEDLVLVAIDGPVATVTMNRPEAMNALSRSLRIQLAAAMRKLEADESVRVVILTGAGERAFTAGLTPLTLGLLLSTGWVLTAPVRTEWVAALLVLGTVVASVRTRISPMWLIAVGAVAGGVALQPG